MIIKPGTYYGRVTHDGPLVPAPAGTPDAVLCRRVVDFPEGRPPTGARIGICTMCGHDVAWNPRGPHPDQPRLCLQCGGIEPLPIESGE